MHKVYMPLKDGQVISKEVMEGLIANGCEVAPITTKGEKAYRESNRNGNILRAIESVKKNKEGHIMFMDSDVILTPGILKDVLDDYLNLEQGIRTLSTDKGTHGLIYVKENKLDHFEGYLKGLDYSKHDDHKHCTLCSFLDNHPNMMLSNDKVKEFKQSGT